MSKAGLQVRINAARVLLAVTGSGLLLDDAIEQQAQGLDRRDQALLQALCYGVMRWYEQLRAWINLIAKPAFDGLDPVVRVLLLLGLYQLMHTRIPAHAAIHATVNCAPRLKAGRAKGLINAVLRNFQRQQKTLQPGIDGDPVARYAHPDWLLKRLQQDWPQDWRRVVEANNRQAPMTLRVDASRLDRGAYQRQLQEQGIQAEPHVHAPYALVLKEPVPVQALPGFAQGLISVQDAAAQLAVPLLSVKAGHRVLDACAAPGGKTAQILQQLSQPPAQVDALDNQPGRLQRLQQQLERIGRTARVLQGDAGEPAAWWDGQAYERILLDAPCSASGVIRRHPDIKFHRSPETLQAIVARQAVILDALWPLLAPGGVMLYVTCSVLQDENRRQIEAFLQRQPQAELQPLDVAWGRGEIGRQVLPGEDEMDGFYFARLRKPA